jgi:hypothetical protein
MATGFPAVTGDVMSAAMFNGLVSFTLQTTQTADYTAVLADSYQTLVQMNKATAIAFKIPTNASVAVPIGSCITILNIGVGLCTISAVTSGTTTVLSAAATAASPTVAQYKSAACIKVAADTWIVVGSVA